MYIREGTETLPYGFLYSLYYKLFKKSMCEISIYAVIYAAKKEAAGKCPPLAVNTSGATVNSVTGTVLSFS